MSKLYIIEKSGKRRKAVIVQCAYCGSRFKKAKSCVVNTKDHFCNLKCYYKYIKPKLINVKCSWCNKELKVTKKRISKSKSGLVFCGKKCKDKAAKLNGLKEIHPPQYNNKDSNDYRSKAFREYGCVCVGCNFDLKKVLEVHHIDSDRGNNDVENLIILCPTHHKMVTYGFSKILNREYITNER